jgi:hypothetical protein
LWRSMGSRMLLLAGSVVADLSIFEARE